MQCTLYIPYLIPLRELADTVWRALNVPQLKMLLARGEYVFNPETEAAALLCNIFGIARQQDSPLAPMLARNHGLAGGSGYWLCATPIHLEPRRNALVLADPATLEITVAESSALATTLADHLRDENVTLHAPQPGQWFLHSDVLPVMTTSSLDAVTGQDVRGFLPQGPDSLRWHRILTEIQMLLHAHPVNETREISGRAAVNSVWLWAGGTLPPHSAAPYTIVWSNDDVACALAHHTGGRIEPAPARIMPNTLNEGSHFFSTQLLVAPMRQGNLQAWSAAVTAIDHDWFHPLLKALKTRRLNKLTIITSNDAGTHELTIRPRDLMKFWRQNKYLQ